MTFEPLFEEAERRRKSLVARDPEPNRFDGFWTYDPALVDRVFASMD